MDDGWYRPSARVEFRLRDGHARIVIAFADPTIEPRGDPLPLGQRGERRAPYLMKRISEYFGSGQSVSGTSRSRRSATSRTASIAGMTDSAT